MEWRGPPWERHMNIYRCTPEKLRDEADQMFDGSLPKLHAFLAKRLAMPGNTGVDSNARWHFEGDLTTLARMISDQPRERSKE